MLKRLFLLLVLFLCSHSFAQDFVFSITFDGGGWFDRSFNQETWTGLTRAVSSYSDDYDIDVIIYDGSPDTTAQGQQNIAAGGLDLMVAAGFLQEDAIRTVSSAFPDSSFVIIDSVVDNPNVRSVLFKEHEGSFVVGYLAGTMTQTGVVGFVGGMDVPLIRAFDLGYREGVQAACASCTIVSAYVGSTPEAFNNPEQAKELAKIAFDKGADIIYAAAGASGNGVIEFVNETMCIDASNRSLRQTPLTAALREVTPSNAYVTNCQASQPIFFIGVDSNQNYLGDTDGNPETLNHGLTSMLKRVDVAAETAVIDLIEGRFSGGLQTLGLAEDGVGYAVDQYNSALIPQETLDALNTIEQQIISGQLIVPDYRQQVQ